MAEAAAELERMYPRCRSGITEAEPWAEAIAGELADLDSELAGAVRHWRFERIGLIERNILRLGLYELRHRTVPPKVAISEAVQLAHWFAGSAAPSFVNGVLDALARQRGLL